MARTSNEDTRNLLYGMMENIKETLTELIACAKSDTQYMGEYDPHDYLADYPLEIVDERGRNYAVVLTTGGPHIQIEANGQDIASLHGYWGGEHCVHEGYSGCCKLGVDVTLSGQVFDAALDYYIER